MFNLTEKAVAAQVALRTYTERAMERAIGDERGQGSVEYLGVVVCVVAIAVLVIAAGDDIGKSITDALKKAVKQVTSGEGGGDGGE